MTLEKMAREFCEEYVSPMRAWNPHPRVILTALLKRVQEENTEDCNAVVSDAVRDTLKQLTAEARAEERKRCADIVQVECGFTGVRDIILRRIKEGK